VVFKIILIVMKLIFHANFCCFSNSPCVLTTPNVMLITLAEHCVSYLCELCVNDAVASWPVHVQGVGDCGE